jgi:hypothetical protein
MVKCYILDFVENTLKLMKSMDIEREGVDATRGKWIPKLNTGPPFCWRMNKEVLELYYL